MPDDVLITQIYEPDDAHVRIVLTKHFGGSWHAAAYHEDGSSDGQIIDEASSTRDIDALFILAGRLAAEIPV